MGMHHNSAPSHTASLLALLAAAGLNGCATKPGQEARIEAAKTGLRFDRLGLPQAPQAVALLCTSVVPPGALSKTGQARLGANPQANFERATRMTPVQVRWQRGDPRTGLLEVAWLELPPNSPSSPNGTPVEDSLRTSTVKDRGLPPSLAITPDPGFPTPATTRLETTPERATWSAISAQDRSPNPATTRRILERAKAPTKASRHVLADQLFDSSGYPLTSPGGGLAMRMRVFTGSDDMQQESAGRATQRQVATLREQCFEGNVVSQWTTAIQWLGIARPGTKAEDTIDIAGVGEPQARIDEVRRVTTHTPQPGVRVFDYELLWAPATPDLFVTSGTEGGFGLQWAPNIQGGMVVQTDQSIAVGFRLGAKEGTVALMKRPENEAILSAPQGRIGSEFALKLDGPMLMQYRLVILTDTKITDAALILAELQAAFLEDPTPRLVLSQ